MPIAKKNNAPTGSEYGTDLFEEEKAPSTNYEASVNPGWEGADRIESMSKRSSGTGAGYFKFKPEPTLIAFASGAPIDSFLQHWITTPEGLRSFRCSGRQCPICDEGDNPNPQYVFWVVEFVQEGGSYEPVQKLMTVGRKVKNALLDIDQDPRKGGPLDGSFFSTHRTGQKQTTQHFFTKVKTRDLEDDWSLDPTDALDAVKAVASGEVPRLYIPSEEDLQNAARLLRKS